ncbi:D-2-hydroxyacid dehydrogenase family protein [Dyadobacter frigoris]|uniref:D-2-hydroxyacid dehydrogenase family protein n=1 Tax=Dyadobacter frigoris TaxID=2576211 RepID=A0A4U6D2Q8_9BACT|nr:D-2-hydroxyacid dehydrogenase family protein [Dyadobacter frigoris]TKT90447.1 D-2-hydroxyacid dehydrogenase family protein [Dyadobacter frigoris]GLU51427.1 2-hydroxyacid dehydrogenase [Dyadobacter frigoris]
MDKIKIAILDDYQDAALKMADWSSLEKVAQITVFKDHLFEQEEIVEHLKPFDIICVMRERTPVNRELLSKLPNLKLIVSTGIRNASIDSAAVSALGIQLENTGYIGSGAPELTWALLMAIARKIPQENASLKSGGWQTTIATDLKGKTIGIVGLGNIGDKIASIAHVFDMNVIAWSENLTEEKAIAKGAKLVSKEYLFKNADFVTVHLVLSERSRGIIGAQDLALMKPSAYLINTSRGPLIDESALIDVLKENKIAGAALDVFEKEPLPTDHPFRKLDNVLATPHIGYVTEDTYKLFFEDTVKIIENWIEKNNI